MTANRGPAIIGLTADEKARLRMVKPTPYLDEPDLAAYAWDLPPYVDPIRQAYDAYADTELRRMVLRRLGLDT